MVVVKGEYLTTMFVTLVDCAKTIESMLLFFLPLLSPHSGALRLQFLRVRQANVVQNTHDSIHSGLAFGLHEVHLYDHDIFLCDHLQRRVQLWLSGDRIARGARSFSIATTHGQEQCHRSTL